MTESIESRDFLTQAIEQFKAGLLTPELVTETFQAIWQRRGENSGINIVVPSCDRTKENLTELVEAGRRIGYLPGQITRLDHSEMAKIFPQLTIYSVQEGNPIPNVANRPNRYGWFDYEASVDAPYRNTNEYQLKEAISSEGKRLGRILAGMNVTEYIVASEDSKLFTGEYLDQGGTWSRLLASRCDSNVIDAGFDFNGGLDIDWRLNWQFRSPGLGGRSVGAKKA